MARGEEVGGPPLLVIGAGHDQDQRDVVHGQGIRCAAHEDRKVGVLEQPLVRLGEQERHELALLVARLRACGLTR